MSTILKMNKLPKLNFFAKLPTPRNILTVYCNNVRVLSTNIAVKEEQINDKQLKVFERIAKMTRKEVKKKPQKGPFAKNIFLGIFDSDILAYPEVLDKEQILALDRETTVINNTLAKSNLANSTYQNLQDNLVEDFKKLNLFGLQVPQILGGRELNMTEVCRITELISENTGRISTIYSDQLGVQSILKKGNEQQKQKYLPKLLSGQTLAALCLSEDSIYDPRFMNTKAILSSNSEKWIINGQKHWIVNGDSADIMIVFAQTEALNKLGLKENKLTAFIVERDFGGITTTACNSDGLENTDISNMIFTNTEVPAENVLGFVNCGEEVITSILTEFRLLTGPMCSTLTRILVKKFVEHCKCNHGNVYLSDTDIVQSKIGELVASIYAMESITYLTAGLLDQYENQDCELEAAIVKVFSSEHCYKSVKSIMEFLGTPSFMKQHWCNKLSHDALSHVLFNEANDNLKLIIALLGVQHAGRCINEEIKKLRNPLYHPTDVLKKMWTNRKQMEDNPKLTLNLKHYLHPTLINSAQLLEYCVLRLQFATEVMLSRHGPDIMNKHIDLKRLADSAIDIYAMAACLSRASRSYCIGLQHGEFEIHIANAFCFAAMKRVKNSIKDICDGPYSTNDINYSKISQQVFHCNDYYPVHPITRNF